MGLVKELRMNLANGALLKGLWDVQKSLPSLLMAIGRHLLRNI